MIVVDASVLIAIVQGEPEAAAFIDVLDRNEVFLPATVLVEANILALSRGVESDLQKLLKALNGVVVAADERIARAAVAAHKRYGKGRHKANLNFGDCFAYATAKALNLPLLFKDEDFGLTDISPC